MRMIGKNMNINDLMDKIVEKALNGINCSGWSKDEVIRFIYVSLGKELAKSPDFFYSSEGKLEENSLDVSAMKKIHDADANFDVTCQVSAKMLVNILKKVGVDAKILQTVDSSEYVKGNDATGEKLDIYHFFVVAKGNDDKNYFLTLNPDLLNVKFGFKTEHFANNIYYHDLETGKQYYQGEEIKHEVMSEKRLKEIDQKIGYLTNLDNQQYDYVPDLSTINKKKANDDYVKALIIQDDKKFYKGLENIFLKFEKESYMELTSEELLEVERYIYLRSQELIEDKLNWKFDIDQENKMIQLIEEKNFKDLKKEMETIISGAIKGKGGKLDTKDMYGNPYAISSAMNNLFKAIDNVVNSDSLKNLEKNSTLYKDRLHELLRFFIDQSKLQRNDGVETKFSNGFLKNKIKTRFEKDFECLESKETGYLPEFCKYGILEQSAFIKDYLKKILRGELSNDDKFYERIMFSSMSLKADPSTYHLLMYVYDKDLTDHTYIMVYDPKKNMLMDDKNYLTLRGDYKILSKTVDNKLNEIENNRHHR